VASCALSTTAEAQGGPFPPARDTSAPSVWASATVGLLQAETIVDGRTNASWDFADNVVQYRATLETAFAGGATAGVQASWAPAVAATVRALGLADRPVLDGCQPECAASADLLGVEAFGRIGGGPGLHQVIEAQAGVTRFANFRADDGRDLAPLDGDRDLSLAVGYGIGYSVSNQLQVTLVQDFGVLFHQRTGLGSGEGSTIQQRVTRLGLRYGLFRQRPGV
jgi:hypothetical protein